MKKQLWTDSKVTKLYQNLPYSVSFFEQSSTPVLPPWSVGDQLEE